MTERHQNNRKQPTKLFKDVWQHPYFNLFKSLSLYTSPLPSHQCHGDVTTDVDPQIAKRVLQTKGKISAINYISLPEENKQLGLVGKYMYVQLKVEHGKLFTIHFDIQTQQGSTVRFSLSNLYKEMKVSTDGRILQLPCHFLTPNKWTILAFHIPSLLIECKVKGRYEVWQYDSIAAVQIGAECSVRNIITSDHRYTIATFPREVQFLIRAPSTFDMFYEWYWMSSKGTEELPQEQVTELLEEQYSGRSSYRGQTSDRSQRDTGRSTGSNRAPGASTAEPSLTKIHTTQPAIPVLTVHTPSAAAANSQIKPSAQATAAPEVSINTPRTNQPLQYTNTLQPDPIMTLENIIGYTSRRSRNLAWSPDGQFIVYSSNAVLVVLEVATNKQQFLTGHTAPINLIEFSSFGLLATGQEGRQSLIRIWNWETRTCLAHLLVHSHDLRSLSFSNNDQLLAAVGKEAGGRWLIVVWDLEKVQTGITSVVAKQLSDFQINRLIFSPYRTETLQLVSVGHESIRCWRIKTKHLPGTSVVLNEHVRNTFTDVAFEANYGAADNSTKRMYVVTASGSLFQINYTTRTLECIYKLHSGPIYSVSINEGFCVTGSGDSFLRVWSLDFSDYYLQAQHKSAIQTVAIRMDGLQVLVGSENGGIGVMDLETTGYVTKVRTHLDTILSVAFDPFRPEFATTSEDGTIRVWGLYTRDQIYEFYSANETATCCAYHPIQSEYRLACGFASGAMRILDIASTTMHVDYQQHTGAVVSILFSNDGSTLYTVGLDGNLCSYDTIKNYLPVRMFTTYRHQPVHISPALPTNVVKRREEREQQQNEQEDSLNQSSTSANGASTKTIKAYGREKDTKLEKRNRILYALAINADDSLLATIGSDPTTVVLLEAGSLKQLRLFATQAAQISTLSFTRDSTELCVVLADSSFQRFLVADGHLIAHTGATAKLTSKNDLCLSSAVSSHCTYLLTGTDSPSLRVSSYTSSRTTPQSFIAHHHSTGVNAIAFTADGSQVITVGGSDIYLWSFNGKEKDAQQLEEEKIEEEKKARQEMKQQTRRSAFESDEVENKYDSSLTPVHPSLASPSKSHPLVPSLTLHPLPPVHYQPSAHLSTFPRDRITALLPEPKCGGVIGATGEGRNNCVWWEQAATLVYSSGHLLIMESLAPEQGAPAQIVCDRHTTVISTLTVSPHGFIATGAVVNTQLGEKDGVRVWDRTGNCVSSLIFDDDSLHYWHESGIQSLAFDSTGHLLVVVGAYRLPPSGTADASIYTGQLISVWQWNTRELLTTHYTPSAVHGVAFLPVDPHLRPSARSPDLSCNIDEGDFVTWGREGITAWVLAKGTQGGTVMVGEQLESSKLPVDITSVGFTPDSNRTVVAGTADGQVIIWDRLGNEIGKWRAAVDGIVAVKCGDNHRLFLSTPSTILSYSLSTSQPTTSSGRQLTATRENSVAVDGQITSTTVSSSGEVAVVSTVQGTIWSIQLSGLDKVRLVNGHTDRINTLQWSPSQEYLASTSMDGSVRLWLPNEDGVNQIMQFQVKEQYPTCVSFHPTTPLFAASYTDGTVRVFDLPNLAVAATIRLKSSEPITHLLTLENSFILVGTDQGRVYVIEKDGKIVPQIANRAQTPTHPHALHLSHAITSLCVSPHSSSIWLSADSGKHVSVWSTEWKLDQTTPVLSPHADVHQHRLLSLINLNQRQLEQNNMSGNGREQEVPLPTLALFSPVDPSIVLLSSPLSSSSATSPLIFYHFHHKQVVRTIQFQGIPTALEFVSDGEALAVGTEGRVVSLLPIDNNNEILSSTHTHSVSAVAVNAHKRWIASAAHGTIRINEF